MTCLAGEGDDTASSGDDGSNSSSSPRGVGPGPPQASPGDWDASRWAQLTRRRRTGTELIFAAGQAPSPAMSASALAGRYDAVDLPPVVALPRVATFLDGADEDVARDEDVCDDDASVDDAEREASDDNDVRGQGADSAAVHADGQRRAGVDCAVQVGDDRALESLGMHAGGDYPVRVVINPAAVNAWWPFECKACAISPVAGVRRLDTTLKITTFRFVHTLPG